MANNNRPDRGKNRKSGNVSTELSLEEQQALLAKELRLKPKSKAVLDELLNNPKMTQREAYLKHHKTSSVATADVNASRLLNSAKARIYSDRAVGKAKKRVVALVDSSNENISLKASQDILDRTEGKAIQRSENTSKVVEVRLDLSGARIGSHYLQGATEPPLLEQ